MNRQIGFNLIELMITVAVVVILGALAYPSYIDYVVEARRTEAMKELMHLANLQEQYYIDNGAYTADLTNLDGAASASYTTGNGYYRITAVASAADATFVVSATALGSQLASDSDCKIFSLDQDGEKSSSNSGGSASSGCWE